MKKIALLLTFCFYNNIFSFSILKIPLTPITLLHRSFSSTTRQLHKDTLSIFGNKLPSHLDTKEKLLSEAEAKKLIDDEITALNNTYKTFYAMVEAKKSELGQESYAQLYNSLQIAHMQRRMKIVKKYTDDIELY